MSHKKVLIDATGIVSRPTGLGNYCTYLLESLLRSRGFQFSVFIQSDIADSHPLRSFEKHSIRFIPVDAPVIGPKREFVFYKLRELVNEHNCLHCLSSYLPAFGLRTNSVVTVHDLKYLIYPHFLENQFKARYYSWIIRKGIKSATHVVAVSNATKQDIERLVGRSENISVIHEAPTASNTSVKSLPDILRRQEFFLFVGENRPHKNILRIVKAYMKVIDKLGDLCPLFVFAGSRYETLEKRYRSGKIIFLQGVSDEVLAGLYKHTLALVYPSLHEGFGLPVLEAMEIGTPVITSNCSAMPEVAGDAALLVDPYDVNELAAAMISLARDTDKRNRLIDAGKHRVKQFSWDKAAQEIIELYEAIIQ